MVTAIWFVTGWMVSGSDPVVIGGTTSLSPLGWQQLLGLEPYPKVAGALGQLVHVDTQAAEAACLTLLTRSELRRAMGAAARKRACETFHPDVVMFQIETLFMDLEERRQQVALEPASSSPQLDLVRTFACYATKVRLVHTSHKILRYSLPSLFGSEVRRPLWIFCKSLSQRNAMRICGPKLCAHSSHPSDLSHRR